MTKPAYMPANIDVEQILSDLNAAGWRDYKIEVICGFSRGYVSQLRCGHIKNPAVNYASRLWNLWLDEAWVDPTVRASTG